MIGDRELRRQILRLLYEKFQEHPYHRILAKEFCEIIGVPLQRLDYNMIYLEEKGYVELQKPREGDVFISARITAKGIDLVEDDFEFDLRFRKDQIEKKADPIHRLEELKRDVARSRPRSLTKDDLLAEIEELKCELKSERPSYRRVKERLNFLRRKEPDVARRLTDILKDPEIIRRLSESIFHEGEE
ncbi:hypothetical protein DRP53_00655 [candidate division WOR-3 bacterium]|uniref:Uncharacterized protein n=1 Tax=candidate division WOR-3 bacterium TaxID=2052148 RepID=A0A660SLT7_UNCW3|nr:MAG: hypothetical protein DRP53_00655 [candidate division WOR-3 bacterium]